LGRQPYHAAYQPGNFDFIYIRWEGDRRSINGTLGKIEVDRAINIRLWADRIKHFSDSQKEVFGYFSKYYSGHPPADARELLKAVETKE
jgi:uncharacterized protein YecE (DUF72 family)